MSGARFVVACSLLALTAARAADVPPSRDRARTYLVLRVVDALDLRGDAALKMREILKRADDERVALGAKRDALDAKLRAALAQHPVDEAALATLVNDAHAVQRELAALPDHTFTEAQKFLTVEQQAKFLLFRRDLQGEVRQALRRRGATATTTLPHPHPR